MASPADAVVEDDPLDQSFPFGYVHPAVGTDGPIPPDPTPPTPPPNVCVDVGLTLVQFSTSPANVNQNVCVFGDGVFIAGGNSIGSPDYYHRSVDGGVTWDRHTWTLLSSYNDAAFGVVGTIQIFVMAGQASGNTLALAASVNLGQTWTRVDPEWDPTHVLANRSVQRIVFNEQSKKFIYAFDAAVGLDPKLAIDQLWLADPDIKTVTGFRAAAGNGQPRALAAHGNTIVVAGGNGALFTSLDNGSSWAQQVSQFGVSAIDDVIYVESLYIPDGLWIAVGASGNISTSPDALAWTLQTSPTVIRIQRVLKSPATGRLIAMTSNKDLISSFNAVDWINCTTVLGEVLFDADVSDQGRFVFSTSASRVHYTPLA